MKKPVGRKPLRLERQILRTLDQELAHTTGGATAVSNRKDEHGFSCQFQACANVIGITILGCR